jgi:hypothetical protein
MRLQIRSLPAVLLLATAGCFPANRKPSDPDPLPFEDVDADGDADGDTDADSDADADTGASPEDMDGDGYDATVDCDDTDPQVNPGASEVCDSIDNDCDGSVDIDAIDASKFYADFDEDGFGDTAWYTLACTAPPSFVEDGTDCYDGNPDAHPGSSTLGSVERGDGSYDYNCDGVETMHYPSLFACVPNSSYTFGWQSSPVPRCGEWGTLSASIQPESCTVTYSSYPQSCS